MLITPHVVTGAAIGSVIANPLLVIPLAVGSHFVLDSTLHWQETLAPYTPTRSTYIRIPIDVILAVTLVWVMISWQPSHMAPIIVGAIMADAPDLDVITILIPGIKRSLVKTYWDWHCAIQRETASLWGVVTQLLVIALSLAVAYETR